MSLYFLGRIDRIWKRKQWRDKWNNDWDNRNHKGFSLITKQPSHFTGSLVEIAIWLSHRLTNILKWNWPVCESSVKNRSSKAIFYLNNFCRLFSRGTQINFTTNARYCFAYLNRNKSFFLPAYIRLSKHQYYYTSFWIIPTISAQYDFINSSFH